MADRVAARPRRVCEALPAMSDTDLESDDAQAFDSSAFACPRCAKTVAEEYYGPCTACQAQLRALYTGEQREVASTEYEPKMNVTPNAVALKD